jgi:hypothetical protein
MLKNSLFAMVVSLGLSPLVLSGCEISNKCGSNLEYVDRACQTPAPGPAAVDAPSTSATTPDAPSTIADDANQAGDDGGGADAGSAAVPSNFGAVCKANAECTGDSNYCAMQPGSTVGYCSASGCDTNPAACPATGWTCMKFPGAPAFCMKTS